MLTACCVLWVSGCCTAQVAGVGAADGTAVPPTTLPITREFAQEVRFNSAEYLRCALANRLGALLPRISSAYYSPLV